MTTRLLAAFALAAALGSNAARAEEPKLPDVKAFDKLVIDSLRDVHNKGADLYNTSKDFVGAYRLYQGALQAVRPLLAHRPDAQKLIDTGLSTADKEPDAARKAFVLHETIEGVRKHLKTAIGERKPDESKKPDDKKPGEKKPEEPPKKPEEKKKPDDGPKPEPPAKKPEAKKDEKKKPDDAPPPRPIEPKGGAPKEPVSAKKRAAAPPAASVGGTITLAGKPLAEGEVTLVSLNQPLPRVFTAQIKDGRYLFKEAIPAGKYAAIVTGKGVPEKYHLVSTSGLTLELAAGENSADLVLK